nr:MAG TPA: hypothetical protein [Caudoviricetes sp.]
MAFPSGDSLELSLIFFKRKLFAKMRMNKIKMLSLH